MSQQYDAYLKAHRNNVKKAYEWFSTNLPECIDAMATRNINLHDASKDEIGEYTAYDNYFYGKKKTEIFSWYDSHKNHIKLHNNTRSIVEEILDLIRTKLKEEK